MREGVNMTINRFIVTILTIPVILFLFLGAASSESIDPEDHLWRAVRKENIQLAEEALKNGATGNVFFPKSDGFGFSRSLKKTALMLAAEKGNLRITKLLITNGAKAALSESIKKHNAFTLAIKNGHKDIAKLLIDNAADADEIIDQAGMALFVAGTSGHIELVEILLGKGVDPNTDYIDPYFESKVALLPEVIKKGHSDIARLLIERGIDVNFYTKNKDTALIATARKGSFEIVKLLIENKAEVNTKTDIGGDTALIAATEKGNVDIVKLLLNNKVDANIKNDSKSTALTIASRSGRLEIVKNLIEFGANVNLKGHRGETALSSALKNKYPEVVCYLIEHGADIDISDSNMLTTAIYKKYHDVIKLLLEKKIDVNSADRYGTTPLMAASRTAGREGYYEIIKMLLEHGADVNAENKKGETALIMAAKDGSTKTIQLFLENQANSNHQDQSEKSPLMHALESTPANLDSPELLLAHGAKCTLQDSNGEAVLTKFIDNALRGLEPKSEDNYFAFLKKIIDDGVDINAQDKRGNTALMTIAYKGGYVAAGIEDKIYHLRAKIVKTLIDNKADTSLVDKKGKTAFDYAKKGKRSNIIELFEWEKNRGKNPAEGLLIGAAYNDIELVHNSIKNGANVNDKFPNEMWKGGTPLVIATDKGYDEIAQVLISEGADVNAKFKDGTSVLMLASQNGQIELVKTLLNKGTRVNEKNNDGMTPLLFASGNGKTDVVKELLNNNADPHLSDRGISALMLAESNGFSEIVQILKQEGLKSYKEIQRLILDLLEASSSGDLNAVRQALKDGVDVNGISQFGYFEKKSPLMVAASEGHKDIVKYLLKHGANIHYKMDNPECGRVYTNVTVTLFSFKKKKVTPSEDEQAYVLGEEVDSMYSYLRLNNCSGSTALLFAVSGGHNDIVELLLQKGVDVDVRNDIQATPLIIAASLGETSLVKLLLERGADINGQSLGKINLEGLNVLFRGEKDVRERKEKVEISPVIGASFGGYTELVKFLIKKGASISDTSGLIALQGAVIGGHIDTVKLLLEKGVAPKSDNLSSLLATASANGFLGIVEVLLDNGMNINGMENDRDRPRYRTPLMAAAEAGHIEVVKLLLDRGANKYISPNFNTAYSLARSNGHKKIMKLLEDEKVVIQSLNVDTFQLLDPACEEKTDCKGDYLHEKLKGDVSIVDVLKGKIPEMTVTRTGIVTDGITRLVLRAKTKQPVKFVLIPPENMTSDRSSKCDWGTLSEYDRSREHCESIEVSHVEGDYTYALYRSPANFPLKSLKKPVFVTIKAIAKTTGEEIEMKIQLFQPPVVLVHGLWSTLRKWKENKKLYVFPIGATPVPVPVPEFIFSTFKGSLEREGLETYSVSYERKNHSTPTFNPLSDSYSIGQLVAQTNLALHNNRKNNVAITQVDVVGHSMGGLIARARTVSHALKYKKNANYQRGDFHKLITIDTPHEGSPHGNILVECKDVPVVPVTDDCYDNFIKRCREAIQPNENEVGYGRSNDPYKTMRDSLVEQCPSGAKYHCDPENRDKLYDFMSLRINLSPFEGALKSNQPIGKAVYDLQVGSKAIKQIPETKIPSHAIVGVAPKYSVDEFGLNRLFGLFDIFLKSNGDQLTVDKLFETPTLHDTVVSAKSQAGGLIAQQWTLVNDVIHGDAPLDIGVQSETINLLLNEEIKFDDNNYLLPVWTKRFGFFQHFNADKKQWTTCGEAPSTEK